MQATINLINKLEFDSALFYGVGVSRLFFNKIKGEKLGIDKYDYRQFPRKWSAREFAKNIQSKPTKKTFDLVVIDDSKHYKDVVGYFKQALKNIKEGGKIVLIGSMPKLPLHVTTEPKLHQAWCGDVYQFVLELISKGGYRVVTSDIDLGVTIIEVDKSIKGQEINISGFEEWYFERKKIMSNYEYPTD